MPTPQDDQVHNPDQQQVDPQELSGEQKPPDSLEVERKRLETLQKNTEGQANEVAAEALSVILAMGWTFGAKINEHGVPEFCIVPVPLEMWQDINREMLRNKLMGK